jgi:hypothetical protein
MENINAKENVMQHFLVSYPRLVANQPQKNQRKKRKKKDNCWRRGGGEGAKRRPANKEHLSEVVFCLINSRLVKDPQCL